MSQNDVASRIISHFQNLRNLSPVVLNLTNYVAMDLSANVLLASGASPIMAHAPEELERLVDLSGAIVINIGTLDDTWTRSFRLALRIAKGHNKPIVLDPVGCGATPYRTQVARELLNEGVTIVRGNASEIHALLQDGGATKGVDSTLGSNAVSSLVADAAKTTGAGFVVSGEVDHIFLNTQHGIVENGDIMMTRVTAMGCSASSLVGALLSVTKNPFEASLTAMTIMGVCGELARKEAKGPGSFRAAFLDQLYALDADTLKAHMRTSIIS